MSLINLALVAVSVPVALWWLGRAAKSAELRDAVPGGDAMHTNTDGLRYFQASEFGAWWPYMDAGFLRALDEFRHRLGYRIMISPAPGSLGRVTGSTTSQHHVSHGAVKAADIMPFKVIRGQRMGLALDELQRAFNIAVGVGFTGIGVYPDWSPYPGMHVDLRADRAPGEPATWSRVKLADGSQSGDRPVSQVWV